MKKLALFASSLALTSAATFADSYIAEFNLDYLQKSSEPSPLDQDSDIDGIAEIDSIKLNGTLFFAGVDDSKGPRREAAFLDKASSASFNFTYNDSDDIDVGNAFALETHVVNSEDWIFEASYNDTDSDVIYGLGMGKYLTDTADLVLRYSYGEDSKNETISLDLHQVIAVGNEGAVVYSLGSSYLNTKDDSGYDASASLSYYFNYAFGLGIDAYTEVIGEAEGTRYGAHANLFLSQNMYLDLIYSQLDADASATEEELKVMLALRI